MGNEAGREAFHARDVDAVGDLAGEGEEEAADVLRVEDPLHAAVREFSDRRLGGDAAFLRHRSPFGEEDRMPSEILRRLSIVL